MEVQISSDVIINMMISQNVFKQVVENQPFYGDRPFREKVINILNKLDIETMEITKTRVFKTVKNGKVRYHSKHFKRKMFFNIHDEVSYLYTLI